MANRFQRWSAILILGAVLFGSLVPVSVFATEQQDHTKGELGLKENPDGTYRNTRNPNLYPGKYILLDDGTAYYYEEGKPVTKLDGEDVDAPLTSWRPVTDKESELVQSGRSAAEIVTHINTWEAVDVLELAEQPNGSFTREGYPGTYLIGPDGNLYYEGGKTADGTEYARGKLKPGRDGSNPDDWETISEADFQKIKDPNSVTTETEFTKRELTDEEWAQFTFSCERGVLEKIFSLDISFITLEPICLIAKTISAGFGWMACFLINNLIDPVFNPGEKTCDVLNPTITQSREVNKLRVTPPSGTPSPGTTTPAAAPTATAPATNPAPAATP